MDKKEVKDTKLSIRVSSQEKERLKEYAAEVHKSMSELLLEAVDFIIHPNDFGKYQGQKNFSKVGSNKIIVQT